jgi:two-component system, response regulator YesN
MYRLLIVDDEEQIVEWLFDMFKSDITMDLDVFKAYSGSEALKWLARTKIDIVMTDICMPGMDGMELLKRIKDSWPECRVIFLTGHEEFEYIYDANRYHGVKYMLKSETDNEIVSIVKNTINELDCEIRNMELVEKAREQMRIAVPFIQKDFLADLLDGYLETENICRNKFYELEIPLYSTYPVLLAVAKIDKTDSLKITSDRIASLHYGVKHIANRYFHINISSIFCIHERTYMVWLMQPSKINNEDERNEFSANDWLKVHNFVKVSFESIQSSCRETLRVSISVALSENPCD